MFCSSRLLGLWDLDVHRFCRSHGLDAVSAENLVNIISFFLRHSRMARSQSSENLASVLDRSQMASIGAQTPQALLQNDVSHPVACTCLVAMLHESRDRALRIQLCFREVLDARIPGREDCASRMTRTIGLEETDCAHSRSIMSRNG